MDPIIIRTQIFSDYALSVNNTAFSRQLSALFIVLVSNSNLKFVRDSRLRAS